MIPEKTDIYAIVGRMKNMIAKEDLALGPAGKVLLNYYALTLKELHEYAEALPEPYSDQLASLLVEHEDLPLLVMEVTAPSEDDE